MDLRGHVLDDAVEKVKSLVVIGLRGDELLENAKQAGLGGKDEQDKKCQHTVLTTHCINDTIYEIQSPLSTTDNETLQLSLL